MDQLGIFALFVAGVLAALAVLGWLADHLVSEERVDAFLRNERWRL